MNHLLPCTSSVHQNQVNFLLFLMFFKYFFVYSFCLVKEINEILGESKKSKSSQYGFFYLNKNEEIHWIDMNSNVEQAATHLVRFILFHKG